ncbi:MAG: hypothetical protein KDJ27_12425 [Gammaproteobacteria bacterium]|nr:hypothetical protein [Gammaproteobacteria bacterium]
MKKGQLKQLDMLFMSHQKSEELKMLGFKAQKIEITAKRPQGAMAWRMCGLGR